MRAPAARGVVRDPGSSPTPMGVGEAPRRAGARRWPLACCSERRRRTMSNQAESPQESRSRSNTPPFDGPRAAPDEREMLLRAAAGWDETPRAMRGLLEVDVLIADPITPIHDRVAALVEACDPFASDLMCLAAGLGRARRRRRRQTGRRGSAGDHRALRPRRLPAHGRAGRVAQPVSRRERRGGPAPVRGLVAQPGARRGDAAGRGAGRGAAALADRKSLHRRPVRRRGRDVPAVAGRACAACPPPTTAVCWRRRWS